MSSAKKKVTMSDEVELITPGGVNMFELSSVRLLSSDGGLVTVNVKIAKMSNLVKNMLEYREVEAGFEFQDGQDIVPLPAPVSEKILQMIIRWCEQHKYDPPSVEYGPEGAPRGPLPIDIKPWDQEYLTGLSFPVLNELLLASFNLDINDLKTLCCKGVAMMLKGKTTEEMRELLNAKDDFTPEEKEEMEREEESIRRRIRNLSIS